MRIRTRTPNISTDPGVQEAIWLERNLTNDYNSTSDDGFVAFARARGLRDATVLNNVLGCNCLPESEVGRQMVAQCWSGASTDLPHSPVRDLWPAAARSSPHRS